MQQQQLSPRVQTFVESVESLLAEFTELKTLHQRAYRKAVRQYKEGHRRTQKNRRQMRKQSQRSNRK